MTTGIGVRRAVPVLPAVVVLTAGAAVWFALNRAGPHGPLALGWVPGPVALTLAALSLRHTAMLPDLPPGARRFWRRIGLVTVLTALGLLVQARYALVWRHPVPARVPAAAAALYLGALLYAVWALLKVPVGPRTRSEWVRLWLDGATVVLGVGIVMSYVTLSPLLRRTGRDDWVPYAVGGTSSWSAPSRSPRWSWSGRWSRSPTTRGWSTGCATRRTGCATRRPTTR